MGLKESGDEIQQRIGEPLKGFHAIGERVGVVWGIKEREWVGNQFTRRPQSFFCMVSDKPTCLV